nr:RNA polymerase II-associated protein 3-like [Lepeophtheirus salmonis]
MLNQPESKSSKKSIDSNKNNQLNFLRLIQKAVVEKDMGNEFFKKGKYQRAVDCYTEGKKCDPKSNILATNRGMAVLKLNREKEAEKDCTLAIMLDPNYAKAYIRQVYARLGLKRYSGAIKDYEKVMQFQFLTNAELKNYVPDRLLRLLHVHRMLVLLMFLGKEEKQSLL